MANFLAMAALISPGDEVLIEHPTYEPLLGAASFPRRRHQAVRAQGSRTHSGSIRQTSQPAMSERTRLIVLTNLHNPSCAFGWRAGASRDRARLPAQHGRARADRRGLSRLPPFRRGRSAVHLGPEFVCTNSLTKVYGLSGLRCGWILAEPDLAERMWRLNDLFGVNQAHPAERLACIAFEHIDEVIGDNARNARAQSRFVRTTFVASRDDVECLPARARHHRISALGGRRHAIASMRTCASATTRPSFRAAGSRCPTISGPVSAYRRNDFAEALTCLCAALDELK